MTHWQVCRWLTVTGVASTGSGIWDDMGSNALARARVPSHRA
ncbi:hypothetical protein [Phormidium nigroviride]|nr:hypothetical protein [Oscillatoria nigro-viridis]